MARKEPGFAERLQTAAKAKQEQLEKLRARAQSNDTEAAARRAAQIEAAKARELRAAERKEANRLAAERREAERAAEQACEDRPGEGRERHEEVDRLHASP